MRMIGLLLSVWIAAALAQYRAMDLIPLPADSSKASFDLKQTIQISPKATLNVLPLLDEKGAYLRPQPNVKPKLCMATVIQGPFAVAFRRPGFSSLAKSIFRC